MRTGRAMAAGALLTLAGFAAAVVIYSRTTGLNALEAPGPIETWLARSIRRVAIPSAVRALRNPVPASAESVADGMAHFADHCASCHANDGSGDTAMGRGFYPKPPDMRSAATQNLSDGELFTVIENGIRFTGMPGWSTGTVEGQASTWRLVRFIRQLPQMTPADIERMQTLNPRSPDEVRQQIEEERFLSGAGQ